MGVEGEFGIDPGAFLLLETCWDGGWGHLSTLVLSLPSIYYYGNAAFIYVYTQGLSPSIECQDFVLSMMSSSPLMPSDKGVPQVGE